MLQINNEEVYISIRMKVHNIPSYKSVDILYYDITQVYYC